MQYENATYVCSGALVDELARAGVQHVVICPGSRSTPLALAFAAQSSIRHWVLIDERSAAFFALGIARSTQAPVALVCTSGTAAANFMPAVAEANLGRVPLIVLTADRPPELRGIGAPQTMDQTRLYGTHVKWSVDLALPEVNETILRYWRSIAGRAAATALAAPPGPVHLNIPFREPLTPASIAGQSLPPLGSREPVPWEGRKEEQPYVRVVPARAAPDTRELDTLAATLSQVERGLIVVGPTDDSRLGEPLARLAGILGFPILADPLSQLRHGTFDHTLIVDSYDAFLRDDRFVHDMQPQVVLRFGAMPTSKVLLLYLKAHSRCQQIVVDDAGGWNDPMVAAEQMIYADAALLIDGLLDHLPQRQGSTEWASQWQQTASITRSALETALRDFDEPFEGRVFSELATLLPAGATLFVGNSMPVRDCDTFLGGSARQIRVLGNRGVNGIDGIVSTALGLATAGEPVVLVLGDLSFYHDLNGLLAARLHGLKVTIVVINNDGGGIFSFLPQAAYPEHFETLFGTPHGLDFRPVVEMYGGTFRRARDWADFRTALNDGIDGDGFAVVEVPTNRATNVTMHRRLWQLVSEQLEQQRAAGILP
jgi:2-succinyl-5-enolpyruvyl-6-hydroxy-3-cyclohexene-1-carboxylate synthase